MCILLNLHQQVQYISQFLDFVLVAAAGNVPWGDFHSQYMWMYMLYVHKHVLGIYPNFLIFILVASVESVPWDNFHSQYIWV
jgi:DNA mismatch repair protein MutH